MLHLCTDLEYPPPGFKDMVVFEKDLTNWVIKEIREAPNEKPNMKKSDQNASSRGTGTKTTSSEFFSDKIHSTSMDSPSFDLSSIETSEGPSSHRERRSLSPEKDKSQRSSTFSGNDPLPALNETSSTSTYSSLTTTSSLNTDAQDLLFPSQSESFSCGEENRNPAVASYQTFCDLAQIMYDLGNFSVCQAIIDGLVNEEVFVSFYFIFAGWCLFFFETKKNV